MELPSRVRSVFEKLTVFQFALALGALVALPGLGSVGLWDPWETHYAEVGRQMLARGDLVHPYWQDAWFFSKPPLVAWLSALGLFISGAQSWGVPQAGPLPEGVEWWVRLPFAAMFLFAGAMLAESVARRASRRAGILVALVWWTMPLVDFLARQAMTDGPFVSCLVMALCCASNAEALEAGAAKRTRHWAGFFAATGVAVLAKGLVGFLPLLVVPAAWLLLEGKRARARFSAVSWWTAPLAVGIPAPWFVAMSLFDGRDDEGRSFVSRFFFYDHFSRLTNGVHTTTPGGTFTYFIEQGAFAIFPWVVLVPVALHVFFTQSREGARWRLAMMWAVTLAFNFTLFTLSATRFHHYVMPMLPPLAVLLALALDSLWEDVSSALPSLGAGLVLLAVTAKDLASRPRHWLDLFTYNHERPYPAELVNQPFISGAPSWVTMSSVLLIATAVSGGVLVWAMVRRGGCRLVQAVSSLALACAVFLSWRHWPQLGVHWTQKALVSRYYSERSADEPLAAFYMNWKGETFYTRNAVTQLKSRDPRPEVQAFVEAHPRSWFLVEQNRVDFLRSVLPSGTRLVPVDSQLTNKFTLAKVERTVE